MAGWLEFNDVPVRSADEKCGGNCDFIDDSVCHKLIGHDHEDECGMPALMFHQVVLVLLTRLYAKNAIRPIPVPLGYSQSVDLYKLFCFVREKGGFESVSRGNLWGLIAKNMDLDLRVIASLKMIYLSKLADLDHWLDSIGNDWNSKKLSDEWGRNLELLSNELEKRIGLLFGADTKLLNIEKGAIEARGDQKYHHGKVASKKNMQIPIVKENNEFLGNGNIASSNLDEKIRENEPDTSAERPDPDNIETASTRKRKRDSEEMLSWLKKTAKNPFDLTEMEMLNSSKWKGNGVKEYLPLTLLVRVAMLRKKYSNSDGIQCGSHQKKKTHPSMYDEPAATCRLPGIRFSKRVPALLKSPKCPCCVSTATKHSRGCQGKLMNEHSALVHPENGAEQKEDKTPDSPTGSSSSEQTEDKYPPTGSSSSEQTEDKYPVQKRVSVGRKFQAEIPTLIIGEISDSDSKWLGTHVWPPDSTIMPLVCGKGRADSCECAIRGSVECVRLHTMENNVRLKRELGRAFYQWRLDRAGETVSLCWSPQEEEDFKLVMCVTPLSTSQSYFPNKTRQDIIDYYFNVFLQRKRRYQNRVTPDAIDSDDEFSEFGSVGGLYGHVATHISGTIPRTCSQNEQCFDIGLNCEGDQ